MTLPVDRFTSSRNPVLAALATNAARPSALLWVLGVLGLGGALLLGTAGSHGQGLVSFGLTGLLSLVFAFAAPVAVAQQVFIDRQGGALDQHRLAGRSPGEVLVAHVLGPIWLLLATLWCVALAATGFALLPHGVHEERAGWLPLGVAAAATAAGLAWSVGGAAFALGIDRHMPLQQAAGVGVLGPVVRVVIYGVLQASLRHRNLVLGIVALEALALALSLRVSLRRLAHADEDTETAAGRYLAMGGAAGVAAVLSGLHADQRVSGLVFPVTLTVATMALATASAKASPTALFRDFVSGNGTVRRELTAALVASALTGLAVLPAIRGPASLWTGYAAAGLAAAMTMCLQATGLRHRAGRGGVLRGLSIGAILGLPALGALAAAVTSPMPRAGGEVTSATRLVAGLGRCFGEVTDVGDLVVRLAFCGGLVLAASWSASRALQEASARARAKTAG